MWNVRNVLRQVTIRLKSSVNGNCGSQTAKDGQTQLEDEYKLWTSSSNLWTNDIRASKAAQTAVGEHPGLLFTSSKTNSKEKSGHDSNYSESERHEWHSSYVQSNGFLEAIGWGAALGLGLNILQLRQDENLRKFAKDDGQCRFSPRWFTNVALSMPYNAGHPGLIRSVLPTNTLNTTSKSRESFSLEDSTESYQSELSDSGSSSEFSQYQKPMYTSETAAMMTLMRQQLTEVASDYVVALQKLLSPQQSSTGGSDRFRKAQEEYNMGLFHELGISVSRNSDQAFKHYVEAALLEHPAAIQNIISFHKYASAFPESETTDRKPASMPRCASSPVLSSSSSLSSSGRDSVSEFGENSHSKGKFWSSSEEDSRGSSSGLSRSSSFPDLPSVVTCVN